MSRCFHFDIPVSMLPSSLFPGIVKSPLDSMLSVDEITYKAEIITTSQEEHDKVDEFLNKRNTPFTKS